MDFVTSIPSKHPYTTAALAVAIVALFWNILRGKKALHLQGRHVIISGASTGLGFALAERIVREGANVSIISMNPERLEAAKQKLEAQRTNPAQKVIALPADVRDEQQVNQAVASAINQLGAPELVVPCAGLSQPGYFADTPGEVFRNQMALNYFGSVYLVKACIPSMQQQKRGSSVFVSSAAALLGFVGYSMYCPTKYAVRGLADVLRNELKLYNIDVSIFYPSSMKTPGFEEEEKTKPAECKEIEGTANLFSASESAGHLLEGVRKGHYQITQEVITWIARVGANGVVPRNNYALELVVSPLVFILQPIFVWWFDRVVLTSAKAKAKTNAPVVLAPEKK